MSCVLAIGQFDGIHLGHQAVLRAAADLARDLGATPLALSFSPHVDTVLHPDSPPLLLATPEQNRALVRACGIADLCLFPFSPEWAARPAADFFRALPAFLESCWHNGAAPARWPGAVRGNPSALPPIAAIVVGENFTCGARGSTTLADLPALLQTLGIPRVLVVRSVLHRGRPVSSTLIRDAVAFGHMSIAAAMLGRPFALRGRVVHGRAEGRQHGLPTANIRPDLPIRPRPGVYAARLSFPCPSSVRRFVDSSPPLVPPPSSLLTPDSSLLTPNSRPAAAFVPDPADPAQAAKFGDVVEVHVPNAAGDWYGRTAEVQFLSFVRPYRAFPDQAAASAQIRRDIQAMRPFWNLP